MNTFVSKQGETVRWRTIFYHLIYLSFFFWGGGPRNYFVFTKNKGFNSIYLLTEVFLLTESNHSVGVTKSDATSQNACFADTKLKLSLLPCWLLPSHSWLGTIFKNVLCKTNKYFKKQTDDLQKRQVPYKTDGCFECSITKPNVTEAVGSTAVNKHWNLYHSFTILNVITDLSWGKRIL